MASRPIDKSAFGRRVKQRRVLLGLKQRELRDRLGLSETRSVSDYETGKTIPEGERLSALADALSNDVHGRCTVDWLVRGDEVFASREPHVEYEHATLRAVEEFLAHDAVAELLTQDEVQQLRSVRFNDLEPTVGKIRRLAIAIVDDRKRVPAQEERTKALEPKPISAKIRPNRKKLDE